MGSAQDRKTDISDEELTRGFCDDVYNELEGVRLRILAVKDELEAMYGKDSEPFRHYERHLLELADTIEWKLQILSHACPYDWKGSIEKVENIVSVQAPEAASEPEFSGGYVGG